MIIDTASPILLAANTVSRLHDINRPTSWAVPFLLIPLLVFIASIETGRMQLEEAAARRSDNYLLQSWDSIFRDTVRDLSLSHDEEEQRTQSLRS